MRGAALRGDGSSSPWSVPSRVLVRGKEHGRAAQCPSSRQADSPVDGIVHDEHFVLIPSPFFFLQGKKLKMSTSDAVLEIKDRAQTVQGQTREALVRALLLPWNPSLRARSCWGPAMSHVASHGDPLSPFYTCTRASSATLWEYGSPVADPSPSLTRSQPTRVSRNFEDAAGPCIVSGGLPLPRHRCPRDQGCLPSSSSSGSPSHHPLTR